MSEHGCPEEISTDDLALRLREWKLLGHVVNVYDDLIVVRQYRVFQYVYKVKGILWTRFMPTDEEVQDTEEVYFSPYVFPEPEEEPQEEDYFPREHR